MKNLLIILILALPILGISQSRPITADPLRVPAETGYLKGPGGAGEVEGIPVIPDSDIDKSGDWTGTFDGQEGTWYQDRSNHTGTQDWSTITGTPTTLSGYGITDAVPYTGATTDVDLGSNSLIALDGAFTGTGAITLPSGTTAQRPGTPTFAMVRGNTTNDKLEGYEGGEWKDLITGASGGSLEQNEVAFGDASGNIISSNDLLFDDSIDQVRIRDDGNPNRQLTIQPGSDVTIGESGTDNSIVSYIDGSDQTLLLGTITTVDTGSDPLISIGARIGASDISVRPILAGFNRATKQWEVSASGDWDYQGNNLTNIGQLTGDKITWNGSRLTIDGGSATAQFVAEYDATHTFSVDADATQVVTNFSAAGNVTQLKQVDAGDFTIENFAGDILLNPTGVIDAGSSRVTGVADPTGGTDAANRQWTLSEIASAGGGDVSGPASSTDNTIARFDGTSGKLIQGSGVAVDDSDNLAIPGHLSLGGFEAMRVEEFELDESDITSLNSSPYELVAAPGAGKAVVVHRAQAILDFNTTAYTLSGSAGFQYDNGTGSNAAALNIQFQGAITATSDYGMASNGSQGTNNQYIFNTNVVFRCFTSNPGGGGDSTMKVKIWYTIEEK